MTKSVLVSCGLLLALTTWTQMAEAQWRQFTPLEPTGQLDTDENQSVAFGPLPAGQGLTGLGLYVLDNQDSGPGPCFNGPAGICNARIHRYTTTVTQGGNSTFGQTTPGWTDEVEGAIAIAVGRDESATSGRSKVWSLCPPTSRACDDASGRARQRVRVASHLMDGAALKCWPLLCRDVRKRKC
jgi:hypothetical protein